MSKKKIIITAVILALVLAIGGILAYFTDVETKTNSFTMGKIDIAVTETNWEGGDDGVSGILPNQTVPKNPQITNNGTIPIYAFTKVVVPYASVTLQGSNIASEQELFTYTLNGYDATKPAQGGWVEVGSVVTDTTNKTKTHVYAFIQDGNKIKELEAGKTTVAVFDEITFRDIQETFSSVETPIQGQQLDVVVTGYGIQTTELGFEEGVDATDPANIWALVNAQN